MLLGTQCSAVRGHDEKKDSDNRSNFLEFCQFLSRHDGSFKESLDKNISFCSKTVQNEVVEIISTLTIEKILEEVKSCGCDGR